MLTRDKSFYRTFIKLMSALMLQQAVVLSVNLADNVMLGGYSETALSGVAAVNQIQFILQQLIFGISNGMVVLASQYWGQKKAEPVRRLMAVAFWAALAIAALLFALVSLFPHGAVGIFTNDEAIVRQGMDYLAIVRFSYLFFAVTTILLGGMRVVEKVNFRTSRVWLLHQKNPAHRAHRSRSVSRPRDRRPRLRRCLAMADFLCSKWARRAGRAEDRPEVSLLVNNAGCGYLGRIGETDTASQTRMVDLNLRSLTAVTNMAVFFFTPKFSHLPIR